jgi:O-antigen/teichoic acid export membrane protein
MTARSVGGRLRTALPVARRLGWGFGDQALSSATNFALGIVVARSVGTEAFGAFSIGLTAWTLALGISRGATSQVLVIRFSGVSDAAWRTATAAAIGTALIAGLASGAICLGIGLLLSGTLRDVFAALGLLMPGLLVQDGWRYAFIANGNTRAAFVNDLVWAIALVPGLVLIIAAGEVEIFWATMVWGLSALAAAFAGILQSGILPAPTKMRGWLRDHFDLASRFVAESVASQGIGQIGTYSVAAIGGLVTTGTLRLGRLLITPLQFVFQSVYLLGVPEAVRARQHSLGRLQRQALLVGGALVAMVAGWTAVLLLIPESTGTALLGDAWFIGQSVLIPLALGQAAHAMASGALIGLRALADAKRILRITVIGSLVMLVASIAGVIVAGAHGVAWMGAAVGGVFAVIWWLAFRRSLETPEARGQAGAGDGRAGAGDARIEASPEPDLSL